MKITVLTMCPQVFSGFLESDLTARAIKRNLLDLEIIDIREYTEGSFRHIDDSPFGGGAGMIMRCEPLINALEAVKSENAHTVLFAPCGNTYDQKKVHEYLNMDHLILICGHYEGIDARVYPYCDELLSMGDYILSGGEIPAMAVIDSLVRLLGTIRRESTMEESFENGLLEYPQYTRPASFKGMDVPEVLLSGNHEKIRLWRLKESLKRTWKERPDLIEKKNLTHEEEILLAEIKEENKTR